MKIKYNRKKIKYNLFAKKLNFVISKNKTSKKNF